jgi:hypothetical protein
MLTRSTSIPRPKMMRCSPEDLLHIAAHVWWAVSQLDDIVDNDSAMEKKTSQTKSTKVKVSKHLVSRAQDYERLFRLAMIE